MIFCFQSMNTMAQTINKAGAVKFDSLFTINVQKPVSIGDELQLTFNGHSHKILTGNDPYQPLLINMEYKDLISNQSITKTEYVIAKNLPYVWRWKRYLFVVTKYEYSETMEMKVSLDKYTE